MILGYKKGSHGQGEIAKGRRFSHGQVGVVITKKSVTRMETKRGKSIKSVKAFFKLKDSNLEKYHCWSMTTIVTNWRSMGRTKGRQYEKVSNLVLDQITENDIAWRSFDSVLGID